LLPCPFTLKSPGMDSLSSMVVSYFMVLMMDLEMVELPLSPFA
jgi:hypothetical protein